MNCIVYVSTHNCAFLGIVPYCWLYQQLRTAMDFLNEPKLLQSTYLAAPFGCFLGVYTTVERFSIVCDEFNLLPNICIGLCEYNVFSRSFVCMKTFETFAILSVLCSPKCAYRLNTLNKSICTCIISVDESGR